MAKDGKAQRANLDRATAEVIEIVREILEVEEQLGPLQKRRDELEQSLQLHLVADHAAFADYVSRPGAAQSAPKSPSDVGRDKPNLTLASEEPPNKMVRKGDPLTCPFSGCNYEAISEVDLADHMAGCQPEDAG